MIYEMMRAMAGRYLNAAVDCYTAHQTVLNVIVVILGFLWIYYSKYHGKTEKKRN
ncbi:hypothetical protein SH2C18_40580 [Clostridium sediminicola]|uniref:hypothetical protein n=1 Tax=Clostridium sediminicola TaxID=3114879 RepID=UPI0031F2222A